MPYTPHKHLSVPTFGNPGWNLSLNQNFSDIDDYIYAVETDITDATSDSGSLKDRIDGIVNEIVASRVDDPATVTFANMHAHFTELDQQIYYASGPYAGTAGEQLRTATAKMNDGSVDNFNIGNSTEADYLTTKAIVGWSTNTVVINPGAGVSYFNVGGKVYSISESISGSNVINGYVILTPASSDAGETDLEVSTVGTTSVDTLPASSIPIGWTNNTGTIKPTFAKNKQYVYVNNSTQTIADSDVHTIVASHEMNLGFVPDQIDVVVKYADPDTGLNSYVSNPPSVQVIVKQCSDAYISLLDVYIRKVLYPMADDVDALGASRCLFYDAGAEEKINAFTGIKVILRYFGTPWNDTDSPHDRAEF